MGKNLKRAFYDVQRQAHTYRPLEERKLDFKEVEVPPNPEVLKLQAERCMDCGIPFCHGTGCPLGNQIPEFNEAVANGRLEDAWNLLSSTSPFPEFTSRICPALCEGSCTCGLNFEPVTVRQIERYIVEQAYEKGLVKVRHVAKRSGKSVAVIGAGPSGLAAATILNQHGHKVTVYERDLQAGGLLRYGIPDFKLKKEIIERRVKLMEAEGVKFETGVNIGVDISGEYLKRKYDAVVIAAGTRQPRDLKIPGRELDGILPATKFLAEQNRLVSGEHTGEHPYSAKGKRVLVIGGGDTGSDCVGTSIRQGAASVIQVEIMPQPPEKRSVNTPWPMWPYMLRTSSSHMEGCERKWNIATKSFFGKDGKVAGVKCVLADWEFSPQGKPLKFTEKGEEFEIQADLVLLAMGFTGIPAEDLYPAQLGLSLERNLIKANPDGETAVAGVFAAGDVKSGPSLVVRAIASGRQVAAKVNDYLNTL